LTPFFENKALMPTSKEELLRRGITPHDIQHNQHRRAEWQDYGGSGNLQYYRCGFVGLG
jgi:hypothetical protein